MSAGTARLPPRVPLSLLSESLRCLSIKSEYLPSVSNADHAEAPPGTPATPNVAYEALG